MNTIYVEQPEDENTGLPVPNILQSPNCAVKLGESVVGSSLSRSPLQLTTRDNLVSLTPTPQQIKKKIPSLATKAVSKVTPSRFENIKVLDEEENWKERATVVTKLDHETYCDAAKEILVKLVDKLPVSDSPAKPTVQSDPSLLQTTEDKSDPSHDFNLIDEPLDPELLILPEDPLDCSEKLEPTAPSETDAQLVEISDFQADTQIDKTLPAPPPSEADILLQPSSIQAEAPPPQFDLITPLAQLVNSEQDTLLLGSSPKPKAPVTCLDDLGRPTEGETPGIAQEPLPPQFSLVTPFITQSNPASSLVDTDPVNSVKVEAAAISMESSEIDDPTKVIKLEDGVIPSVEEINSVEVPEGKAAAPVACLVNPETESKMAEPESPLPLPKGGYNIDWDNFDENINPFQPLSKCTEKTNVDNNKEDSNKKTDSEINPFQSKTKMANSPPESPNVSTDDDPFQPKNKMAASPLSTPVKNLNEAGDINQNVEALPPSEKLDEPREGEPENVGLPTSPTTFKSPPKKKAVGKKSHIRFKVPDKTSQSENDEIQIFAPPPPKSDSQTSSLDADEQFIDALPPPPATTDATFIEPQSFDIPDEEFKDASEAVFSDPADWDMLDKFGSKNNSFTESTLARQSLYVKFDPLVKGRSPEKLEHPKLDEIESEETLMLMGTPPPKERGSRHPATRLLEAQVIKAAKDETSNQQSPTDNKTAVDKFFSCSPEGVGSMMNSSMIGSSEMTESREQTIKPMMTSSWLETIKNYSELEGDSAIFSQDSVECLNWNTQDTGRAESPLRFDHEEVLRIDSSIETESGKQNINSPSRQGDSLGASTDSLDIVQVLKYSQRDYNRMKKDLELDYQARFLAKECDWQKEKDNWEKEKDQFKTEVERMQKHNEQMKTFVSEYEVTMTQLIAEKESASSESKDSMSDLVQERDQALDDLNSVEQAFSDLHRRYETLKAAIDGFKKNEDMLKKKLQDSEQKFKKYEEKHQALKKHAEDKLEAANQEIERVTASSQSEVMRMKAALKRAELQIQSLEQQLEQKVNENHELTAICDELINSKEGGH